MTNNQQTVNELLDKVSNFKELAPFLTSLLDKLDAANLEIVELKNQVKKPISFADIMKQDANTLQNDKKMAAQLINTITRNTNEKMTRQNNIVVSGVDGINEKEGKSDKQIGELILAKLELGSENVKIERIVNKANKAMNLIKFSFDQSSHKRIAFANSNRLNDGIFAANKLYVNNDLTAIEAQVEKNLRIERNRRNGELTNGPTDKRYGVEVEEGVNKDKKFYFGIKNGKIVKKYL
jgi:hypothetical protein